MKNMLLWVFGFASLSLASPSVWILGEDYLGFGSNTLEIDSTITPQSAAFDSSTCGLWVQDKEGLELKTSSGNAESLPFSGRILTHQVTEGVFVTEDSTGWQVRDSKSGIVLKKAKGLANVTSLEPASDCYWALQWQEKENRIAVTKLSLELAPIKTWVVSENVDVWTEPHFVIDRPRKRIAVAFNITTPTHIYSPVIQIWDWEGIPLSGLYFAERGLTFDVCLDTDGEPLVARDIPSDSGFTVPVYSFLERVVNAKPTPIYGAPENQFIDSLSCHPQGVWMIQRSIFGSDGSRAVFWDKKTSSLPMGETVFKLPGKAWKIFACPVG